MIWRALAVVVGIPALLLSQIPPSEKLDPADEQPFHDEIHRLEKLLDTVGDRCTVLYALARTWAAGHQYRAAMDTLEKAAALKVGLDPSNDDIFAKLRGTKEFERLLGQIRVDSPPIVNSVTAFTIDEPDLFPEGIAFGSRHKLFFLGSTTKHKIVACTPDGACRPFAQDGLGSVLGVRADPRDGSLWATSNGDAESALIHYAVPSGKLIRKYPRSGKHLFNDIAIDRQGNVFVTDTREATVYWVARKTDALEILAPALKVQAANGIALSEQGRAKLYISSFPDGITVIDIASKSSHPIAHPANLCLGTIDGLYFFAGSLYAIQNGIMVHRVVRLHLSPGLNTIDRFDILERRNPLFNGGPTTAAIAEGALYYMANPQLDSKPGVKPVPIKILKVLLP